MVEKDTGILERYTEPLSRRIQEEYAIGDEFYHGEVKKGLRNSDGTGVLVGVTKVGSVQGYLLQDGQRVPIPGRLYYRGIELNDIVEAHRSAGTFGFEEVAYLLLMGYLPTSEELARFNSIMSQARKLPEGFTEGMIMRHPSENMMNELARSVLSLYSYDPDPDDTSIANLLLQSVKLIGCFPSIVANAYAVKRHYFQGDSLHIHFPVPELSTAENFLRMIRPDTNYTEEEAHLLDMMLMVHAEHGGGNNSTFVCRAMSSSGTDTYSAIAGAVGSLKGPLHGGANAKVMEMFHYIKENVDPRDDNWPGAFCAVLDVGNIGEVCRPLLHGDVMPVDGDGAIRRTHDAAAGDQLLHAVGAPARDTGGGKQRREHIRRDAQHGVYQTGVHIHVGAQRRVVVAALLHQRDAQLLHLLQKGEVLGIALDLRQMLGVLLQQHGAGVGDGVYRVTEAVQLAGAVARLLVQQLFIQIIRNRFRIAGFKSCIKSGKFFRFCGSFFFEPFQHLLRVNLTNLTIGNLEPISVAARIESSCQVAGHIEQTPDVFNVGIHFVMVKLLLCSVTKIPVKCMV